jgi:hypothetical protein
LLSSNEEFAFLFGRYPFPLFLGFSGGLGCLRDGRGRAAPNLKQCGPGGRFDHIDRVVAVDPAIAVDFATNSVEFEKLLAIAVLLVSRKRSGP